MTTHINREVLKQILIDFPQTFTSDSVTEKLKSNGYNYKTSSGELSHNLKKLGYVNMGHRSKVWTKKIDNSINQTKQILKDLTQYPIEELIQEIKRRGYTGTLNPPSKSIIL